MFRSPGNDTGDYDEEDGNHVAAASDRERIDKIKSYDKTEYVRDLKKIQVTLEEAKSKTQGLRQDMEDLKARSTTLTSDIFKEQEKYVQDCVGTIQQSISELQTRIKTKKKDIEELESKIAEADRTKCYYDEKNSELAVSLESRKEENTKLEEKIGVQSDEITALESKIAELREEEKNLHDTLTAETRKHQASLADRDKVLQNALNSVKSLKDQIEELKSRISAKESEKQTLLQKMEQTRQQVEELDHEHERKMETLNEETQMLKESIIKEKKIQQELQRQIDDAKAKKDKDNQEYQRWSDETTKLIEEKRAKIAEFEQSREEFRLLQLEVDRKKKDLNTLTSDVAVQMKEASDIMKKAMEFERKAHDLFSSEKSKTEEYKNLLLTEYEDKQITTDIQIGRSRVEIERNNRDLQTLYQDIQEEKNRMKTEFKELDKKQKVILKDKEELKKKRRQVRDLQRQLEAQHTEEKSRQESRIKQFIFFGFISWVLGFLTLPYVATWFS